MVILVSSSRILKQMWNFARWVLAKRMDAERRNREIDRKLFVGCLRVDCRCTSGVRRSEDEKGCYPKQLLRITSISSSNESLIEKNITQAVKNFSAGLCFVPHTNGKSGAT